ncbi:hypothetical protein [Pedobacter glucosidilyticus]|uniref:hypothetical protein n=1 Tax=Pedobacter glucosidilyticus TaxID=1122941 RepID=UPI0026F1A016|nr:hypothetical protein [Pedobacter glucosidilyticus]
MKPQKNKIITEDIPEQEPLERAPFHPQDENQHQPTNKEQWVDDVNAEFQGHPPITGTSEEYDNPQKGKLEDE